MQLRWQLETAISGFRKLLVADSGVDPSSQAPAAPHTKTEKSVPVGFIRFEKRGQIKL